MNGHKRQTPKNPFVLGQLSFALGSIGAGLTLIPDEYVGADRLPALRVGAIAAAIAGTCFGAFALLRERPPVLAVFGIGMCAVSLFWNWIAAAAATIVAAIVVLAILASWLSP